jgi:hypothetical protein
MRIEMVRISAEHDANLQETVLARRQVKVQIATRIEEVAQNQGAVTPPEPAPATILHPHFGDLSATQQNCNMREVQRAVGADHWMKAATPWNSPPAPDAPTSYLLKLPPELRIEIYHLVVKFETESIVVDADGYSRSSLLATCREVRAEALHLLCDTFRNPLLRMVLADRYPSYYSNKFVVKIREHEHKVMWRFKASLKTMCLDVLAMDTTFQIRLSRRWEWLTWWLRIISSSRSKHEPTYSRNVGPPSQQERCLIQGLFDMAKALKRRADGNHRQLLVQELSNAMRPALIAVDRRWVL